MKRELTVQVTLDLCEIESFFREIVRGEIATLVQQSPLHKYEQSPSKDLLNSRELAEYLGVSLVSVYRLRKNARIGYYRVGSRVLFSISEHVRPYLATTGVPQKLRKNRNQI